MGGRGVLEGTGGKQDDTVYIKRAWRWEMYAYEMTLARYGDGHQIVLHYYICVSRF